MLNMMKIENKMKSQESGKIKKLKKTLVKISARQSKFKRIKIIND
jgi:biotin carboxyl carrier protein